MELRMMMVVMMMMVRAEGMNVTKVRAELGTDVSLNCSIRNRDIYWFVEIYGQIRAGIGRLYHPKTPEYYSLDFKSKYFMVETRLEIKNVNVDDCRSYFCAEKNNGNLVFVDSFLLESDVPDSQTPSTDSTSSNQNRTGENRGPELLQRKEVVISSLGLNGLLLLILIGLMFLHLRKRRSSSRTDVPEHHQTQETYYEEVNLPPPADLAIYHKVQHPL
ncbi:uncharacterized protein LOC110014300 isoform X3 [Oryzias latipes]|uniref:uncharacterized protein LOC110014300 isoform X3 n=1 Tax=Oryzias latipes TaxID=8090 RepID=UPI000CE273C8|nr:uncharacterized protein LOC110014300 isoform X3 [Oryzias latipes]